MKNKIIIPIIIIVMIAGGILLYKMIESNNINVDNQELKIKNVKTQDLGDRKDGELNLKSHLFKNYSEYKKFMSNYNAKLILNENDFKNNDFVLDFQTFSSCTDEKEKKLIKIEIEESIMNFTYEVYNKCGECEDSKNIAYLVPIKKGLLKELLPISSSYNSINAEVTC